MTILNLWEHRAPSEGGGRPVAYDDVPGEIAGPSPNGAKVGICCWAGGALLGNYVDGDRLVLQIGPDKFDLDAPDVRATKAHNLRDGTTEFRISQDSRQRTLTYPGWWVGIIDPPEGVGGLPEMDREEDRLGWVFDLLESAEERKRSKQYLLEPW